MADVIREVIIKAKLELDSSTVDPLKKPADTSRLYDKSLKDIRRTMRELRTTIKEVADAAGKSHRDAITSIDERIKAERKLTDEIDKRKRTESKRTDPGKRGGREGIGDSIADVLGGDIKKGFSSKAGAISIIASSVALITKGPLIAANAVNDLVNGLAAEMKGGQKAAQDGFFTTAGNKFRQAGATAAGAFGFDNIARGLQNSRTDKPVNIRGPQPIAPSIDEQRSTILQQMLSNAEEMNRMELSLLNKKRQLLDREVDVLKQRVDAERQRLDAAKQEFGLMSLSDQKSMVDIAEQAKREGVQSLNRKQLDMVRGNEAFKGVFSGFANQNADANGLFNRLIEATGAAQKQRDAQKDLDVKVAVQNKIDVEINAIEDVAQMIAAQLTPVMQRLGKIAAADLQKQLDATRGLQANERVAANPGF